LAQHSKGLIAMSACLRGDINETILADRYDEARRMAYSYSDMSVRTISSSKYRTTAWKQDKRLVPVSTGSRRRPGSRCRDQRFALPRRDDARAHEILNVHPDRRP